MREPQQFNGVSALELTMRDVLDGMEELANDFAFAASCADFEILGIEPPEGDEHRERPTAAPDAPCARPYLAYEQSDRHVA